MQQLRMGLPAGIQDALVIQYRGCWQVIDRRNPVLGETVLAYSLTPGDRELLVGKYDGRSVTDGSETWTKAIIRGVVIGSLPIAEDVNTNECRRAKGR